MVGGFSPRAKARVWLEALIRDGWSSWVTAGVRVMTQVRVLSSPKSTTDEKKLRVNQVLGARVSF